MTTPISHPEKVLFPDDGITKGELAAYYEAVAPVMLAHIRARPVTMERFPSGLGGGGFLQKDVSRGFPSWLERVEVPKKGGTVHYPLANDERSLLWMANQNCVTLHVWTSRTPHLWTPDLCVFDLDPPEGEGDVARAALQLRDLLDELQLPNWVKTSGSKGFHIVIPLDGTSDFEQVASFAHAVGARLVERDPEHLTQEFMKADRGGRIFIDTGRNGPSATFAAAYTVRARPGAPISAPCTWDEVANAKARPRSFRLRDMPERVEEVGDLWADLSERGCSLKDAIERLGPLALSSPPAGRAAALRAGHARWIEEQGASDRTPRTRPARQRPRG